MLVRLFVLSVVMYTFYTGPSIVVLGKAVVGFALFSLRTLAPGTKKRHKYRHLAPKVVARLDQQFSVLADRSAANAGNWCALSPNGSCSGREVAGIGGDTPCLGGEKDCGMELDGMELGGVGVSELEV